MSSSEDFYCVVNDKSAARVNYHRHRNREQVMLLLCSFCNCFSLSISRSKLYLNSLHRHLKTLKFVTKRELLRYSLSE